jgi:hypothetical protein
VTVSVVTRRCRPASLPAALRSAEAVRHSVRSVGRRGRIAVSGVVAVFYLLSVPALAEKLLNDWRWLREGEDFRALIVGEGAHAGSEAEAFTVRYGGDVTAYGLLPEEYEVGDTVTVRVDPHRPFEVRAPHDVRMEVLLGAPLLAALAFGAPPLAYWLIWKRRPKSQPTC